MIGAAANEVQPEVRPKPYVIGAAAGSDGFESRSRSSNVDNVVVGVLRNDAQPSAAPYNANNGRSGIVIGLRNNDRRRK